MAIGNRAVAAITFNDNRSVSMDVENVAHIEAGEPIDAGDGEHWFVELLIRTRSGTVALQLLADEPDKLRVHGQDDGA